MKDDRKPADLTFDNFVRETGIWSEREADPESEPPEDDS